MVLTGLKVTVVGLLVVFFGLVVLIACISVMHALMAKKAPKPAGTVPAPAAPAPAAPAPAAQKPLTYVPGPQLKAGSSELFAVLTAAVAATLEKEGVNPEGGFKITSVKPL